MSVNTSTDTLRGLVKEAAPRDLKCILIRLCQEHRKRVEDLREAVRIRDVSSESTNVAEYIAMADWTRSKLQELDFQVGEWWGDVAGWQVLLAKLEGSGQEDCNPKKTVAAYLRLEVDSVVDEDNWDWEPFSGDLDKDQVLGRGASGGKGQLLCWLSAIEAYRLQGLRLPFDLKLAVDCGGVEDRLSRLFTSPFFEDVDVLCLTEPCVRRPCLARGAKGEARFALGVACANRDLDAEEQGGVINEAMSDVIDVLSRLSDRSGRVLIPGLDIREQNSSGDEELPYLDEMDSLVPFCPDAGLQDEEGTSPSSWQCPRILVHSVNSRHGPYFSDGREAIIPGQIEAVFSVYSAKTKEFHQDRLEAQVRDFVTKVLEKRKTKNRYFFRTLSNLVGWMDSDSNPYVKPAENALKSVHKMLPENVFSQHPLAVATHFFETTGKNVVVIPLFPPDGNPGVDNEKLHVTSFLKGSQVLAYFLYYIWKLEAGRTSEEPQEIDEEREFKL